MQGLDRQADVEELSAWMDGELPSQRAERVAGLVRTDPRWRTACEQFRAVDRALEALTTPRPRRELTDAIVRAARRGQATRRVLRVAAPLAAAAAIVVAVLATRPWRTGRPARPTPTPAMSALEKTIAEGLPGVRQEDRYLVLNLPMFEQLPEVETFTDVREVADAETLAALAGMEAAEGM